MNVSILTPNIGAAITPQMDPGVEFVHFEGNSDLADGDAATAYRGRRHPISIYTHPGRHPQH